MGEFSALRIIFAGTPTFAAQHLQALINSPHDIVAVYTQPDRPAGRGKKLSPSPVKQLALENNLLVNQPSSLKNADAQHALAALKADVMVVVAYGLILPQAILDNPKYGCINVHGSLLPRWRGAAPVQRAIEAGDKETGVTIMQMDAGLDTGPMLLKVCIDISDDDNSESVLNHLAEIGAPALLEVLDLMTTDQLKPQVQEDALATYANKIEKVEARIDWSLPAVELQRKIRAFNPFPVAFSELNEQRVKIYAAKVVTLAQQKTSGTIIDNESDKIVVACGENALAITQLQLPGKKALPAAEVLRGHRLRFSAGANFL